MNKSGVHEICSVNRGQATSLAESNLNYFIAALWSFWDKSTTMHAFN